MLQEWGNTPGEALREGGDPMIKKRPQRGEGSTVSPLGGTMIFNLFCLGTGHKKDETNQTMRRLHDDCKSWTDYKYICDGPTGLGGVAAGAGMNALRDECVKKIRAVLPLSRINMAGHSRGAMLCHMVAHKLS